METLITSIIWILLTLSAYHRNKKWKIGNNETRYENKWTRSDAIESFVTCLFVWYFVWTWVLCEKIRSLKLGSWFDKDSKI